MSNIAILLLRLLTGGLMAGHGAQKLFGWFEGPGLEGTQGMVAKQGLRPARPWAWLAALSEFGGGVLMALGFLNPLGPMGVIGAMGVATSKAHWGKPIWVTKGGAEYALTNLGIATAVVLAGPGKYSLDHAFGIKPPRWLWIPGLALPAAGIAAAVLVSQPAQPAASQPQPAQEQPGARAESERAARAPAQPENPPEPPHTADTVPLPEQPEEFVQ